MKKIILIIFLFLVGSLVIFNKNNDNRERKIESSDEKRGIFVSNIDSIYKSNIYPWSSVISSYEGVAPGYDVLDYFIKKAHERGILVYIWINPYRVRSSNNIDSITESNPAFKYIGTDTLYVNNGIYYNPAKKEVEDLIVSGVEEVVSNYKIDGFFE